MPKPPNNKPPKPGRGVGADGRALGLTASRTDAQAVRGDAPTADMDLDGKLIVERRHVDWLEHQIRWRWLLDSFEGGDRYRNAVYGPDRRGLPTRNLFRHKREYPDPQQFPQVYQGFAGFLGMANSQTADTGYGPYPGMIGADPGATAQDDDYELRRSRTPVPEFVAEAVEIHLSKVFDQEVSRDGPDDLKGWWEDVDGKGTPIDDWMCQTLAPLLLVLGCIDVCLDHPQAPPGEEINTRADELRLGLDKCVAAYILPENMVWWRLDAAGRYLECLVREYQNPADRVDHDKNGNAINPDDAGNLGEAWRRNYVRYRLWSATESILFSYDGSEILGRVPHPYGRVPIVRLVDQPKHRTPHIGKSRYEAIAEYQREYYNRDSELILSDTLQAHPFLSGAEDFCKADNTLSVGPGYVLPMKKNPETGAYQGWEFVSPPKDPAESLRKNKSDLVDMKDRRACLVKPAGVAGVGSNTVSQSGVSKQLDAQSGNKLLTSIAKSLARAERFLAEYALLCIRGTQPSPLLTPHSPLPTADEVRVIYPARFELFSAGELTDGTTKLQVILKGAGEAPQVESIAIRSIVRQLFLGLTDDEYEALDAEIESVLAAKARIKEQMRELGDAGITDDADALAGDGSAELAGGEDPTGQSGGTMVSNMIPAVV
ncbi:MAG: hypothetical protein ACLQIB_41600 [Isosphaeraceae bacterium]